MKGKKLSWRTIPYVLLFITGLVVCFWQSEDLYGQDRNFYVATTGDDLAGDGSQIKPWKTITHALDSAADGSTILVQL